MISSPACSVRFSRTAKIFFIPPISEIAPTILSDCHYSDSDFEDMQGETVRTIRAVRMNGGRSLNEEDMTERGLEHLRSFAMVESRRKERNDVIDGVLDEQERQRNASGTVVNEEAIASASRMRSKAAVDRAIVLGSTDAAFVRSSLRLEARNRTRVAAARAARATAARVTTSRSVLKRALAMINVDEHKQNKSSEEFDDGARQSSKSANRPSRRLSITPLHEEELTIPTVTSSSTSQSQRQRRSASMPGTFDDLDTKKQPAELSKDHAEEIDQHVICND